MIDRTKRGPAGEDRRARAFLRFDRRFRAGSLFVLQHQPFHRRRGRRRNAARAAGRRPVAGLRKGGLVVLHEGKPRAAGKSEAHHNLLPIAARLIEGEPLAVQSVKVAMQGRSLRWLLGKIDRRRTYFLNGEIQTGKVEPAANVDLYRPVAYSGQTMTLHYARAQELGPWLDLVAARGEVFVQFLLRPGESAVTLGVGEEREVERIPKQLKRFL